MARGADKMSPRGEDAAADEDEEDVAKPPP
jgi:hypothetical protein